METYTEKLAQFAIQLKYKDIPKEVVKKAKLLILDSLGCTVGAWQLVPGEVVLETAQELGGNGPFRVVGSNVKLPLSWTIFANSYGGNLLDFDDVHPIAGHPGATIIPPALALIQNRNITGKELITTIVAAYEIGMRIANAIAPSSERSQDIIGFATWQIFTSALVAARLLKLTSIQTAHALAIAGTRAVVPYVRKSGRHERPYAWVKNNYGWTALGGYLSVEQASRGFRGNLTLLNGSKGFWLMAGSDNCQEEKYTEGLSETFKILDVGIKPYPTCRHIHTALDALWQILREHPINPDEIRNIVVFGSPALVEDFIVPEPVDVIDAQFSLSYTMALMLLGYKSGYPWLNSDRIHDPEVIKIAKKIQARVDQPASVQAHADWPVRVKVYLKGNETFEEQVLIPRGHPDRPLTIDEQYSKYKHLSFPVIGEINSEKVLKKIMNLEDEKGLIWFEELTKPLE
ncbi:MmgE/PrpD family protein [Chloroflexota bacterium]